VGLDLVVEGCAKPGHEVEWRQILERSFGDDEPAEKDIERFGEITIPAYERTGAPRVGYDRAADEWAIKARNASTPEEIANVLVELHGYHVLQLADCDGVPEFSHGGLYEGVDETSFRGKFLTMCTEVLSKELIEKAWEHKFPEGAIEYGAILLASADAAESAEARPEHSATEPGWLARLGFKKRPPDSIPLEEQIEIVRAAGKWFVFWGKRGHAIRAWF